MRGIRSFFAVAWSLWKNRKKIRVLMSECKDLYNVARVSLEDKKITKDEVVMLTQSMIETLEALLGVLGVK